MNPFETNQVNEHKNDIDNQSTEDLLKNLLQESSWPDWLDKINQPSPEVQKQAKDIVCRIADGDFSKEDEKVLQDAVRAAYESGTLNKLQKAVNDQFREAGIDYKLRVDTSLAKVQDIGYIAIDVSSKDGKEICSTAISIDNSPRVPHPLEFPPIIPVLPDIQTTPEQGPVPRLDIPEWPGKRK